MCAGSAQCNGNGDGNVEYSSSGRATEAPEGTGDRDGLRGADRDSEGGEKRSVFGWMGARAACGAMAIALITITLQTRRNDPDTAKLAKALAILNDPATKEVMFGE